MITSLVIAFLLAVAGFTLEIQAIIASTRPTLVVPRFNGGSVTANAADQDKFWLRRGYPADALRLGDTYNDLIAALEKDLGPGNVIPAPYDYRLSMYPAPSKLNGVVPGLLKLWNDPREVRSFKYCADYVKFWLIEAVKRCPDCSTVNVVTHSTGHLILRSYMQSDAYGQYVLDAEQNRVRLPKIHLMLFAAPPNLGAPFVYIIWNGDYKSFKGAERGADVFRGYSSALRHVNRGGVIRGDDYDITRKMLGRTKGLARTVRFLHLYATLMGSLVPTYPFLYGANHEGPASSVPRSDKVSFNRFLTNLNSGSSFGNNPWLAAANRTVVTYPVRVSADRGMANETTYTSIGVDVHVGRGGSIVPFTAFDPDRVNLTYKTGPRQRWLTEVYRQNAGDSAFPQWSMGRSWYKDDLQTLDSRLEQVKQWGNGPSVVGGSAYNRWASVTGDLSHNHFIENPAIISWIVSQMLE